MAFLKLDIEGAEMKVLADGADRLGNVRALAVEYHSFVARPQRLGQLLTTLEDSGMRLAIRAEQVPERPVVESDVYLGMDLRLNIWGWRDTLAGVESATQL